MKNWIKNRLDERTSWDGAALIAVGVIVLSGLTPTTLSSVSSPLLNTLDTFL